jgi:hypothetical protein
VGKFVSASYEARLFAMSLAENVGADPMEFEKVVWKLKLAKRK